MWINRDFLSNIGGLQALPIKVLKGPRQVGKTSLLTKLGRYQIVFFDDLSVRQRALENPRLFLDEIKGPVILDEASLVPPLFLELKRRVDQYRRDPDKFEKVDVWITGSNQTLLQKNVQESLAGRASYFDLNTLSLHELPGWSLSEYLLRGGWPELHAHSELRPVPYLNDLIATFVEKDIVAAAGIERREAFSKSLQLIAGRVGQLFNASDIARDCGVDTTTIQSWLSILEQNGILRRLQPYFTNLNKRLIKGSKFYFEDVGLATRLQGWTESQPLLNSPSVGHLVENIAIGEVVKFFTNRGEKPRLNFVRSKEKHEIDLLIHLPNQRVIAAEIKMTPQSWTEGQVKLVDSLDLQIVDRWVLSPTPSPNFADIKAIEFGQISQKLQEYI